MSRSEDDSVHTNQPGSTDASLVAQLATQLASLYTNQPGSTDVSLVAQWAALLSHLQQSSNDMQNSFPTINLGLKLNESNYSLWSRLIQMNISRQGKLQHLTGVPAPPTRENPGYPQWEQNDMMVFSWILNNMEPDLLHQYAFFPTAKDLWNALFTTYNKGKDGIQLFDLIVRANSIKQGTESLEAIYIKLQKLWWDIEIRDPNPMKCSDDIRIWNTKRAETKLYQFLNAVTDEYDQEKWDLLRENPLPDVETAYATIRKERDRRQVMGTATRRGAENPNSGIGSRFYATPQAVRPIHATKQQSKAFRGDASHGGGVNRRNMRCSHCGKFRHSREECFQLIGFPEGWKSRRRDGVGAGSLVTYATKDQREGDGATPASNRDRSESRSGGAGGQGDAANEIGLVLGSSMRNVNGRGTEHYGLYYVEEMT